MPRIAAIIVLTAFIGLQAGCFFSEHKEVVTLNPDGSGKSQLDVYLDPPHGFLSQNPPGEWERAIRRVMFLVKGARGVDVWSDVSYEILPDNRIHFKGTAYFKDVSNLRIDCDYQGGGLEVVWKKADDGRMTLDVESIPKPELNNEQTLKLMAEYRAQWKDISKEANAWFAKIGGDARGEVTYLLPGKVEQVEGFTSVPGGVRLTAGGKQMIAAVDKLMGDDDALRQAIAGGRLTQLGGIPNQEMLAKLMFARGLSASVAGVGDAKPRFDYQAETGEARKAFPAMLERLNQPLNKPMVPAPVDSPGAAPAR